MAREREKSSQGPGRRRRRFPCRALAAVIACAALARAEDAGGEVAASATRIAPPAADALEAQPSKVTLRGAGAVEQVLVSATAVPAAAEGRPASLARWDVTRDATYRSSDSTVVEVDPDGLIRSAGDGAALVHIEAAGRETSLEVVVEDSGRHLPMNFANEIIPIFTKYGCNSGPCHGKAEGRNGFKLSLLGFDPDLDHESLVKQGRGRRVSLDVPEESLVLLKPSGKLVHEGGQLLDPAGNDYSKLIRWIRAGAPFGSPQDPRVTSIEVIPRERVLSRGGKQQLKIMARYGDGRFEDVTRLAQYESGAPEMAESTSEGLITATADLSGETAVMVRYQGQVGVFRATIPHGAPPGHPAWAGWRSHNFIDDLVLAKLRKLELPPSDLASDAEFLRRASLDICGTVPDEAEVIQFLADGSPDKRSALIDELLERPEYASFFALKWGDLLRIRRDGKNERMQETYAFHEWLRRSFSSGKPYDRMVTEILTAAGEARFDPPAAWYREAGSPEVLADDTAQVFLGTKIGCAQCHHHPFERWSQKDYYGMVSFFSRLGRKPLPNSEDDISIVIKPEGAARHPKTGEAVLPRPLGGEELRVRRGEDPREKLASWMADPANPYFARALANRMWAHFFGKGITEPVDDLRATNPPSNPELLDALARRFVESEFDLKDLVRTICRSRAYQLASQPNEHNARDSGNFSRYVPKRLQAEVLLDSVCRLTGQPETFPGLPKGARAIDLPDETAGSAFLVMFGKPRRVSSCECERPRDASLGQSLHLLNSDEVLSKIHAKEGRAARLAADTRTHEDKVREVYRVGLAREPGTIELEVAVQHIREAVKDGRQGYEDLIWALVNTKEFQFNH